MKDWEKELTKKYKGKSVEDISSDVKYDESYGYFFIFYNKIFIVELDELTGKIKQIKLARLKRKH